MTEQPDMDGAEPVGEVKSSAEDTTEVKQDTAVEIGDLSSEKKSEEAEEKEIEEEVVEKPLVSDRVIEELVKSDNIQDSNIQQEQGQDSGEAKDHANVAFLLPLFHGTDDSDIEEWIHEVYDIKATFDLPEDVLVHAVLSRLRGPALDWYSKRKDSSEALFDLLAGLKSKFGRPSPKPDTHEIKLVYPSENGFVNPVFREEGDSDSWAVSETTEISELSEPVQEPPPRAQHASKAILRECSLISFLRSLFTAWLCGLCDPPTQPPATNYNPRLVLTLVCCLGQVSAGLVSGYPVAALGSIMNTAPHLVPDPDTLSWIVSGPVVGSCLGCLVTGLGVELLGRRGLILLAAPLLSLSWVAVVLSTEPLHFVAARFAQGVLSMACTVPAAVLVGECSGREERGRYGCYLRLALVAGNLLSWGGGWLGWRGQAVVGAILPLGLLGLAALPESPAWLRVRARKDQAEAAVVRLALVKQHLPTKGPARAVLAAFLLAVVLLAVGECSGGRVPGAEHTLLQDLGGWGPVLLGVVELLCVLCSSACVDSLGRKNTLVVSCVVTAAAMLALALHLELLFSGLVGPELIPLTTILITAGHSLGLSTVPHILLVEMLPVRHRGYLAALGTLVSVLLAFTVTKSYHFVSHWFTPSCPFWVFFSVIILGFFFVQYSIPETKGKTLEQIESLFRKRYK